MILVIALYHFNHVDNPPVLQEQLLAFCKSHEIKGTLILAEEGINGTVAGEEADMRQLLDYLRSLPPFSHLEWKESWHSEQPFLRMKVKLKKEIVTMGQPGVDPRKLVGSYVQPSEWNSLISQPDVTLVDTRNDYEYALGTFKGALNPDTESFREFPEYVKQNLDPQKNPKVAMFCTGGIRCEKATAYLLEQGFKEVYHLKGGILKYLEEVSKDQTLWEGECFVFDNRVTVTHDLEKGSFGLCPNCRNPLSEEMKQSPQYEEGVSCPVCFDELTPSRAEGLRERMRQIQIAKERGLPSHIGVSLEERRAFKQKQRAAEIERANKSRLAKESQKTTMK